MGVPAGGRSVLVTGATGGIGRVTVFRLAGAGWDVIAGVRGEDKARALERDAAERGLSLRTVLLDVASEQSCRQALAEVAEMTGGGLWALVNIAGIPQAGPVADVDDERARYLLEVNLLGPARLCRLVLPGMAARGTGRIVNISSGLGRVPWPMGAWYSAGKHALSALTHCLRVEAAHLGVRVCLVEPGAFATPMLGRALSDLDAVGRPESPGYKGTARLFSSVDRRVPGPEPVARTVERCLTARHPRPRYVVGRDARLLVPLHALLPLAWTDRLKHAVTGLPRTPAREGRTGPQPPEPAYRRPAAEAKERA
ncbi:MULTISPECIES: SDR family oxidoreductase [Streptacidiphilus]|uniref:SDR family oxidoreductase n=1 Tax=Streptacidiphilus cavernicola TaxID=3342716 RepID=A0ABV6UPB0_9ACTN|nr:SDR family oxidoreductase [Streptacidiphilus jeojiense]